MRSKKASWLLVGALLLVAYVGSYACWKSLALRHYDKYDIIGYFFIWPYDDETLFLEDMIRRFYGPLIIIDMRILGGEGPAPHFDYFDWQNDENGR